MRDSVVHRPGTRARWTTANVDEGLPGTLTALTWSFYFPAVEQATRDGWFDLGATTAAERPVPDDIDERFFTAVYGQAAANVDLFGAMADRMPGASAESFELQLFGSAAPVASRQGWAAARRRYPVIAIKAGPTIFRAARAITPLAADLDRWWRATVSSAGGLDRSTAARRLAEARGRFAEVLGVHLVLTMAAQGLLERVALVAEHAGLPGLERELVKSAEGTAEFQLVADLHRLARGAIALERFLADHGYHGPQEGLLDAVVWREDPAPVLGLAEAYRGRGRAESTDSVLARRRREQADALARLTDALGPVRAAPARMLVRLAAHAPTWRETGRASILRVVDVGRAAARAIGQAERAAGRVGDPDDVFLFSVEELLAGPLHVTDLAQRRAAHDELRGLSLPHVWTGTPTPHVADPTDVAEHADGTGPAAVAGIGVSSGVAEGVVRVIHDQREAELGEGEVLVCRITDPGWAPLFPLAVAVVTDVGSVMSHAAIVCRELGIPCVAGTRDGTHRLRDGDRVRVDGSAGIVTVVETAAIAEEAS
jgi:pyruvate,water dikinase